MESMEANFSPYTPELNRQKEQALSFKPGGTDVAGTGWTIAAQIAKFCGIPLTLPIAQNNHQLTSLVPYAKCLTDILAQENYSQFYIQGSNSEFASTKVFWEKHGAVKIRDSKYYEQKRRFQIGKEAFWGIEDLQLYQFIKEDLDEITKDTTKPFAVYAITIDTHVPYGYLSKQCPEQNKEKKEQYPQVLHCASWQLSHFLDWAETQPWYANTLIAVMGDHTNGILTPRAKISKGQQLYWIDFFINSSQQTAQTQRNFSSFDMYPTILEAMGAQIEGSALGLGISLFSDKPTLLEIYPQKILDSLLLERNKQYDYFLYGSTIKNKIKASFK